MNGRRLIDPNQDSDYSALIEVQGSWEFSYDRQITRGAEAFKFIIKDSIEGGERDGKENELQDSALLKSRESYGDIYLRRDKDYSVKCWPNLLERIPSIKN